MKLRWRKYTDNDAYYANGEQAVVYSILPVCPGVSAWKAVAEGYNARGYRCDDMAGVVVSSRIENLRDAKKAAQEHEDKINEPIRLPDLSAICQ